MSEEEDDENIYNADLYTDAELLEFLDMTPQSTDRELEAKIIQMMHQFPDHGEFFRGIYGRLFDLKEDEDEDEDEDGGFVREGMQGMSNNKKPGSEAKSKEERIKELMEYFEKNIVQNADKLNQKQVNESLLFEKNIVQNADKFSQKLLSNGNVAAISELTTEERARQSTVFTKALDYIKDPKNLNPTFNKTIQRVIILDSRCRDRTTNPKSTDFTLKLSEDLKNVLALNFYYVNVPYTWYTVSEQFGANFFLMNGTAPGISDKKYSLKFSIPPGNYTSSQELVNAVNKSIQAVAKERTDISFGTSSIVLTSPTAGTGKATFTWDIQNRFGDSNYELHFPNWTSPVDFTESPLNGGNKNNSTIASLSIPGFLGFLQPTYSLASIYSNFEYTYRENFDDNSFQIDATNNAFTIYNHDPSTPLNLTDPTTYYDKIQVSLNISDGWYNRSDFVTNVTNAMANHPKLTSHSELVLEKKSFPDPDERSVERFRLSIQLNRYTTLNRRNQVQTIVFPDETYRNTERYPVWTGPSSALYFDSPMRINSTLAEIGSIPVYEKTDYEKQSNQYYYVEDSPKLHFKCTRMPPGIADSFNEANSFTVEISNDNYTLSTYLNAVNHAFRTQVPPNFNVINKAPFYYDYYGKGENYESNPMTNSTFESCVYAEIDFQRNFTSSEYIVDATNSILHKTFNLPAMMDLSKGTNKFESTFTRASQYRVDNTNRQVDIRPNPSAPGGQAEPIVSVFLPYAPQRLSFKQENPNDGQWYVYKTLDDLRTSFVAGKYGISNYKNDTAAYEVAPDSGTYEPQGGDDSEEMTEEVQSLYGLNLSNTDISFQIVDATTAKCTVTWNISNSLTEQDYTVELEGESWTNNLGFELDETFVLAEWTAVGKHAATIYAAQDVATTGISIHDTTIPNVQVQNNQLVVQPRSDAESLSSLADKLTFSIPNGYYNRFGLVRALNAAFLSNPITAGTQFTWYNGNHALNNDSSSDDLENVRIDWNINKVYTAQDYKQTFFDLEQYSRLTSKSTTENFVLRWDQTMGWLLGFRSLTSYDLYSSSASSNDFDVAYVNTNTYTSDTKTSIVTLEGDTPVNINLYNQLHIVLDDFTSNHMNDGIITVAPPSVNTTMQSYASSAGKRCTVTTNGVRESVPGFINTDPASTDAQGRVPRLLTQNQVYSSLAQNQARIAIQNAIAKTYSPPPNVKDMFALIPLKLSGLTVGQSYTEFGGTLQQNNRKYYGPVNIRRIGLKLLSDRGTLVDLNNNDWSIGIICDISIQA